MNYETQKQLRAMKFSCAFCGCGSKLDLKECPGCGRSNRTRRSGERMAEAFANALPIAECYVYVCEHCRYQTSRALAECPECGRNKLARLDAAATHRGGADLRSKMSANNKAEIGKFLLILSISLFIGAFFTFLGFGTSGYKRTGRIVAAVGQNWETALVLFTIGAGCVIAGMILKNKD